MLALNQSRTSPEGDGGARRDRTADLLRARQALSQLSYGPSMLVFVAMSGVAHQAASEAEATRKLSE